MTQTFHDATLGRLEWRADPLGGHWRGKIEWASGHGIELNVCRDTGTDANPLAQPLLWEAARSAVPWLHQTELATRVRVAHDCLDQYNMLRWRWDNARFSAEELAGCLLPVSLDVQADGNLALFYTVDEPEPSEGEESCRGHTVVASFDAERNFLAATWIQRPLGETP